MGYFNAKVGDEEVEECTGGYGLGSRNKREDTLIKFCQNNSYVITNTLCKLTKPDFTHGGHRRIRRDKKKLNRLCIDWAKIKEHNYANYKNAIMSAKTYPNADIVSDHHPVIIKVRLKMKLIKR